MKDLPRRQLFPWVGLLVLTVFVVLAAVNLWGELQYSMHGTHGTGKVIEFHAAQSRSMSIEAEVEVVLPGIEPFRWEVDDAFGTQNWQVDGIVPLLCARIHRDHVSCVVDSWRDRFLLPILALVVVAAGLFFWLLKRRRSSPNLAVGT